MRSVFLDAVNEDYQSQIGYFMSGIWQIDLAMISMPLIRIKVRNYWKDVVELSKSID